MLFHSLRNMAEDNGMARSIFLSALMVTSVMTGLLFFGIEDEGVNGSPTIDSDVPDTILIGEIETVNITISDEEMGGLSVLITLNGEQVTEPLDANGVVTLDISSLGVGSHALQVVATDSLGQDSTWTKVFSINYPDESGTIISLSVSDLTIAKGGTAPISGLVIHDSIDTCSLRWSTTDASESGLGLPIEEDGSFDLELSNIQENTTLSLWSVCGVWTESSFLATTIITVIEPVEEGCTDPSASNYDEDAEEDDGSCEYDSEPEPVPGCTDPSAINYDEDAEEDDGSCEYDSEPVDNGTGSQSWWEEILLCDSTEQVEPVDDYNTTESDNHLCQLSFEIGETEIVIDSNGIPNHDLESGPGCCTSEQNLEWRIPLVPNNQTGCDPSLSTDGCTMAPERDAVAFSVNGVPIFGPEDGPGGDAVAGHEGAYEEANQTWMGYSINSSRGLSEHSPIVGFAFDGYPIYGFVGWDEEGNVSEMKSSYRLKDGETGYNGIDDYEYIVGLGDLDSCNGQFGPTPDYPEGIYHYHTTWENGEGGIGFPYFINCYRGEVPLDSQTGDGDGEVDCSGRGETWGPGIGPPPEGCEGGPPGQSSDISSALGILYRLVPPSGGMLAMMVVAVAFVRVLAFAPVSPSQAGITALYRQARV